MCLLTCWLILRYDGAKRLYIPSSLFPNKTCKLDNKNHAWRCQRRWMVRIHGKMGPDGFAFVKDYIYYVLKIKSLVPPRKSLY